MPKDRERHARFLCRMWDDEDWKALSPRAQWFYLLLVSQASINRAGVIALTSKRWMRLASGPAVEQQITLAMDELESTRFLVVDRDTEEVLVRSYMRGDGVEKQPNVLKAACRQATEVLSPRLRTALEVELRRLETPANNDAATVLSATIRTLSKGSQKGSPDPSRNGSKRRSADDVPSPAETSKSEPLTEPFREPFAKPRGVGEGVGSSSHLGNSKSFSSSSEIASRTPDPPRPEVDSLCSRLLDRIHANGARGSITKKWRTEARLLLDRDRRPFEEACQLIDWATSDNFWKPNILSMPTFRAKYDQLRLQSARSTSGHEANGTDQRIAAWLQPPQLPALRALPGGA